MRSLVFLVAVLLPLLAILLWLPALGHVSASSTATKLITINLERRSESAEILKAIDRHRHAKLFEGIVTFPIKGGEANTLSSTRGGFIGYIWVILTLLTLLFFFLKKLCPHL